MKLHKLYTNQFKKKLRQTFYKHKKLRINMIRKLILSKLSLKREKYPLWTNKSKTYKLSLKLNKRMTLVMMTMMRKRLKTLMKKT